MDEQSTKRGGPLYWLSRKSQRVWIVVVVLLPVLYVLSFGPAHWFANSRPIRFQTLHQIIGFYRPLHWIAERAPVIDRTIRGYVDLWSPERPIIRNGASLKPKTPSKKDAVPPW